MVICWRLNSFLISSSKCLWDSISSAPSIASVNALRRISTSSLGIILDEMGIDKRTRKLAKTLAAQEPPIVPVDTFPNLVYVAQNIDQADKLTDFFANDTLVGFDTETNLAREDETAAAKLPSVVQLANKHVSVIFQTYNIFKDAHRFPPKLKTMLGDTKVVKVGVGIAGDAARLDSCNICVRSTLELGLVSQAMGYALNSLKDLHRVFGAPSVKLNKWRYETKEETNWDSSLSPSRIKYAAMDAFASWEVGYNLLRNNPRNNFEPRDNKKRRLYKYLTRQPSLSISKVSKIKPEWAPSLSTQNEIPQLLDELANEDVLYICAKDKLIRLGAPFLPSELTRKMLEEVRSAYIGGRLYEYDHLLEFVSKSPSLLKFAPTDAMPYYSRQVIRQFLYDGTVMTVGHKHLVIIQETTLSRLVCEIVPAPTNSAGDTYISAFAPSLTYPIRRIKAYLRRTIHKDCSLEQFAERGDLWLYGCRKAIIPDHTRNPLFNIPDDIYSAFPDGVVLNLRRRFGPGTPVSMNGMLQTIYRMLGKSELKPEAAIKILDDMQSKGLIHVKTRNGHILGKQDKSWMDLINGRYLQELKDLRLNELSGTLSNLPADHLVDAKSTRDYLISAVEVCNIEPVNSSELGQRIQKFTETGWLWYYGADKFYVPIIASHALRPITFSVDVIERMTDELFKTFGLTKRRKVCSVINYLSNVHIIGNLTARANRIEVATKLLAELQRQGKVSIIDSSDKRLAVDDYSWKQYLSSARCQFLRKVVPVSQKPSTHQPISCTTKSSTVLTFQLPIINQLHINLCRQFSSNQKLRMKSLINFIRSSQNVPGLGSTNQSKVENSTKVIIDMQKLGLIQLISPEGSTLSATDESWAKKSEVMSSLVKICIIRKSTQVVNSSKK
ncbi:hypothetical protein BKA69DRAFT_452879 [Paraphysoderma sedebokerense]|nr:hypothetical protein BKA69DRAFT_452879 [Paraphysoderma sedebokerense]